MVKRTFLRRCFAAAVASCIAIVGFQNSAQADVRFEINSTYTGPAVVGGINVQDEIASIEAELEGLLVGWRGPQSVESRYRGLDLTITVEEIDDVNGILAFAGPDEMLEYGSANGNRGALVTAGSITIDQDDIAPMVARGSFRSTVMHEMFHAIGSGTLWEAHGLVDSTGFGYLGANGLDFYQRESGNTFAGFVPLESAGGPGTAGGHWEDDDPYFVDRVNGRQEINTGTEFPGFDVFISNVTLASFRDIGYLVPSLGGDEFQFGAGGITVPSNGSTKPQGEDQNNTTGDNGNGGTTGGNGGTTGGNGGTAGSLPGGGNGSGSGIDDPINGPVGAGDGFGPGDGVETSEDGVGGTSGGTGAGGDPVAVPEPSSGLLLMSLLVGFGVVGNRRRNS